MYSCDPKDWRSVFRPPPRSDKLTQMTFVSNCMYYDEGEYQKPSVIKDARWNAMWRWLSARKAEGMTLDDLYREAIE